MDNYNLVGSRLVSKDKITNHVVLNITQALTEIFKEQACIIVHGIQEAMDIFRNSHTLFFPIIAMYTISRWKQNGTGLERKTSTFSVIKIIYLNVYDLTKGTFTFQ